MRGVQALEARTRQLDKQLEAANQRSSELEALMRSLVEGERERAGAGSGR